MNWTGDVFVVADAIGDAELRIEDGSLDVTGNVVVLGEGDLESEFEVRSGGSATINGSLFIATDPVDNNNSEAEFEIETGGSLTINGLLTMMGSDIDIEIGASSTNALDITGGFQIAGPSGSGDTSVDLDLRGMVEIHKDDAMIAAAAQGIQRLGVDYAVTEVERLVTGEITSLTWSQD